MTDEHPRDLLASYKEALRDLDPERAREAAQRALRADSADEARAISAALAT